MTPTLESTTKQRENTSKPMKPGTVPVVRGMDTFMCELTQYVFSPSHTVMDGHRMRVFTVKYHPEMPNLMVSAGWDDTIQVDSLRLTFSLWLLTTLMYSL